MGPSMRKYEAEGSVMGQRADDVHAKCASERFGWNINMNMIYLDGLLADDRSNAQVCVYAWPRRPYTAHEHRQKMENLGA